MTKAKAKPVTSEAFMGLAFKAQAQSRATISALVELKYPRQATFVKQANIAHEPQQVINAGAAGELKEQYAQASAHDKENSSEQNKLLMVRHTETGPLRNLNLNRRR